MSDEIVDVAMEGVFHGFTSAEFGQGAATGCLKSTLKHKTGRFNR